MDRKEQGRLLREWRRYYGVQRKRKLSLMELAGLVSVAAEAEGFTPESRRIPGSHAAMTRWELGDVEQSMSGLQIIASIYGVTATALMGPPPEAGTAPKPDAPADELVDAFREFMATRKKD